MYGERKIMALIPARGGSKGIKRKNIINLCGKPLITYSIVAAKESKYIDKIFVSTEDSEIAETARKYGAEVPCLRPMQLAEDTSTTLDVVLHAVQNFVDKKEYDALILLQPTQPLRTSNDIDRAIDFFYQHNRIGLVSISEVDDSPILVRVIDKEGKMKKLLDMCSTVRRQDMPQYYRVNGAIYINAIEELNSDTSFNDNKLGFIMDKSHSVDIDEEKDMYIAQYYLEKLNGRIRYQIEKKEKEVDSHDRKQL